MSSLLLTEEQLSIRKTARDFVREHLPVGNLRALRNQRSEVGLSKQAWKQLAELGFAGICLSEEAGGSGLGYAELGLVLEECGRTLAATPFLSTVVLGAGAVELAGTEAQRQRLLPRVCDGSTILAFAHEEHPHHAPDRIETRARREGDHWVIDGEKTFVLDGHIADEHVVVARTDDVLSFFLLPRETAGVHVDRTLMVDSRNAARVRFSGARAERLPSGDDALLDRLLDRARVALSAEMLGGTLEAFDRTIAYLKEREQFGVKIGAFQALKHRAAQMFCEIELTKSIVLAALRAIDEDREDVPLLASAAKARASDTFTHVAAEAIQMHGGIGMTDEHDIGLYYKRARACELAFGDAPFHRDRYARLAGY